MFNYTNSSLATYQNITDKKSPRNHDGIDTIIIHCIVGQCTAKGGVDYFYNTPKECSVQYVVGYDGSIGQSVEEKYRAWTTGGLDHDGNPIRVNGISGADMDHRSVTIEVACDTTHPYAITDAAYEALITLCADICKRNGIPELKWKGDKTLVGRPDLQNMVVHRWFAYKACPGDYIYERLGDIARRVNEILSHKEDNDMTVVCPCCGEKLIVNLEKAEVTPTPQPVQPEEPKEPETPKAYQVGDVVQFHGDTHYSNAWTDTGSPCTAGPATISATYPYADAVHQYHLIGVPGGGSNVYGWVNREDFD